MLRCLLVGGTIDSAGESDAKDKTGDQQTRANGNQYKDFTVMVAHAAKAVVRHAGFRGTVQNCMSATFAGAAVLPAATAELIAKAVLPWQPRLQPVPD